MSAPLHLTAQQLRNLAAALDDLSKVRRVHDVDIDPHTYPELGIGDSSVRISWDDQVGEYVINDRSGD